MKRGKEAKTLHGLVIRGQKQNVPLAAARMSVPFPVRNVARASWGWAFFQTRLTNRLNATVADIHGNLIDTVNFSYF